MLNEAGVMQDKKDKKLRLSPDSIRKGESPSNSSLKKSASGLKQTKSSSTIRSLEDGKQWDLSHWNPNNKKSLANYKDRNNIANINSNEFIQEIGSD